jgi:hypothetical protein
MFFQTGRVMVVGGGASLFRQIQADENPTESEIVDEPDGVGNAVKTEEVTIQGRKNSI